MKPKNRQRENGEGKLKSFFNTSKNVLNKQQEVDAMKKKKKKEMKARQIKPQGYTARKMGVVAFWVLFGFMFIVVLFSMFNKGGTEVADSDTNSESNLLVSNVQGVDFAKDFIYSYLNFSNDDKESYYNNLAYYVDSSVDLDTLASSITSSGYESLTNRNDISLVDTQTTLDGEATFTFRVKTTFAKKINEYEDVIVLQNKDNTSSSNNTKEQDDEDTEQEAPELNQQNTTGEKIRVQVPKDSVESSKYIQVQIKYIDNVDRYIVTQLPSYVGFDTTTQVDSGINKTNDLKEADSALSKEIEAFLPTFFNSYLKDDKGTLAYILKDKENSVGLVGSDLELEKVADFDVYEGLKDDEYLVVANVVFKDANTNTSYPSVYNLVIQPQNDNFIVLKLNDLDYKYQLKHDKTSTLQDETSVKAKSDENDNTENEVINVEETE